MKWLTVLMIIVGVLYVSSFYQKTESLHSAKTVGVMSQTDMFNRSNAFLDKALKVEAAGGVPYLDSKDCLENMRYSYASAVAVLKKNPQSEKEAKAIADKVATIDRLEKQQTESKNAGKDVTVVECVWADQKETVADPTLPLRRNKEHIWV